MLLRISPLKVGVKRCCTTHPSTPCFDRRFEIRCDSSSQLVNYSETSLFRQKPRGITAISAASFTTSTDFSLAIPLLYSGFFASQQQAWIKSPCWYQAMKKRMLGLYQWSRPAPRKKSTLGNIVFPKAAPVCFSRKVMMVRRTNLWSFSAITAFMVTSRSNRASETSSGLKYHPWRLQAWSTDLDTTLSTT